MGPGGTWVEVRTSHDALPRAALALAGRLPPGCPRVHVRVRGLGHGLGLVALPSVASPHALFGAANLIRAVWPWRGGRGVGRPSSRLTAGCRLRGLTRVFLSFGARFALPY